MAMMMVGVAMANPFTNHAVAVGGGANVFSPNQITIAEGDTVTWTNEAGFHNVVSDAVDENGDPIFSSGTASIDNWTYEFTFNTAGTYTYICQPHATIGMVGTVIVQEPTAVTVNTFDALNNNFFIPLWTLAAGLLAVGLLVSRRFFVRQQR